MHSYIRVAGDAGKELPFVRTGNNRRIVDDMAEILHRLRKA